MGLAIAATTLPEGLGGRAGSKALVRLAASERRYADKAQEATALLPGPPNPSARGADPLMIASGAVVDAIAAAGHRGAVRDGDVGDDPGMALELSSASPASGRNPDVAREGPGVAWCGDDIISGAVPGA